MEIQNSLSSFFPELSSGRWIYTQGTNYAINLELFETVNDTQLKVNQ